MTKDKEEAVPKPKIKKGTTLAFTVDRLDLMAISRFLNSLVDTVEFTFTKDEVECIAVDPAHVAMAKVVMEKPFIQNLIFASEDKKINEGFAIDLCKVLDFLKVGSSNYALLYYNKEASKVRIQMGSVGHTFSLLGREANKQALPNVTFTAHVSMPLEELKKACKANETLSDHITLIAEGKELLIIGKSETDEVIMKLENEDVISEKRISSGYPLDYIKKLANNCLSKTVFIDFADCYPSQLWYNVDGMKVIYMIAPRIENE